MAGVAKYFDSFPHTSTWIDPTSRWCFYLSDEGEQKHLWCLDLQRSLDLNQGVQVCDEDFKTRSFAPLSFDPKKSYLYLVSDELNQENYNCYRVHTPTRRWERLTSASYASGVRVTPDFRWLFFGDRVTNQDATFTTTLYRMSLETLQLETLANDQAWEYRFAWGAAKERAGHGTLVTSLDWKNRRMRLNLAEIDPKTGEWRLLLPRELEQSVVYTVFEDVTEEGFFFVSNHEGFTELYAFEFSTEAIQKLTNHGRKCNAFSAIVVNGAQKAFVAALPNPRSNSTEIVVTDLHEARPRQEVQKDFAMDVEEPDLSPKWMSKRRSVVLEGNHYLTGCRGAIWLWSSSMESPPTLTELDFASLKPLTTIPLIRGDERELIHSQTEFRSYTSFDGLEIPAFLSRPRGPLKAAVVTAFYGGDNYYNVQSQILLEHGVAVLSPAVRGTWGRGHEWEQMLKGDLGGNEILDLVWGARFLERELGLPPEKIGVEGGSHGGYAALRALTMPAGFKGVDSKYPFGFGLIWAGFADLVDYYKTSRIPDWIVNLLGPFEGNEDKYVDRSPLTHFKELQVLQAPLFIVHGKNDTRVSPTSMQGFLDRLQETGHPHEVHIVEGQGHSEGGRKEQILQYTKQIEFLKRFVLT